MQQDKQQQFQTHSKFAAKENMTSNKSRCSHLYPHRSNTEDFEFFLLLHSVLQIRKSLVRFQMVSLKFFIDIILPIAL